MVDEPIDAVITWVDGSDPEHLKKRNTFSRKSAKIDLITSIPSGKDSTRFKNNGELAYCILSIKKFAPWIRTIYIVTDNQRPDFLSKKAEITHAIKIVDHREIFEGYEWALPTFNSRSIETMIYRIKGLSDKFLYFNDDIFLLKKVKQSDFFRGEKVLVRGKTHKLTSLSKTQLMKSAILNQLFSRILKKSRPMHIRPQMLAATMAGFSNHFIKNLHTPFAVRKATISDYFLNNPIHLTDNIQYRFRNMLQFNTMPLANHLEAVTGNYIEASTTDCLTLSFTINGQPKNKQDMDNLSSGRIRFLCVQSLERANTYYKERIYETLEDTIGTPADFFGEARDREHV